MSPHDPNHPYVRSFVGCGHGRLFAEHCKDCEVIQVQVQYRNAIRTVQRCRNELRRLGVQLPGEVTPPPDHIPDSRQMVPEAKP